MLNIICGQINTNKNHKKIPFVTSKCNAIVTTNTNWAAGGKVNCLRLLLKR